MIAADELTLESEVEAMASSYRFDLIYAATRISDALDALLSIAHTTGRKNRYTRLLLPTGEPVALPFTHGHLHKSGEVRLTSDEPVSMNTVLLFQVDDPAI